MARYGVQVIGRGRQCFVVANIPGVGGFRKGPMPEEEAMAIAQSMADELKTLQKSSAVSAVIALEDSMGQIEDSGEKVIGSHRTHQMPASKRVELAAILVAAACFIAYVIWSNG